VRNTVAYILNVKPVGDHLHFTVTGENTAENVSGYFSEVLQICQQRRCSRVLIETNLQGPSLNAYTIFSIISEAIQHSPPGSRLFAYVDTNPIHDMKAVHFAETVAVNRGITIKSFLNVPEAERWLADQQGGGSGARRRRA